MPDECRRCALLSDRIEQLERALARDITDSRWETANVISEFVRVTPSGDAFVHCEPALGETPEEFERRYQRVRTAEQNKLRPKLELIRESH